MDVKILKEITKLMKENDLVEVDLESGDLKIKMKKAYAQAPLMQAAPVMMAAVAPAPAASGPVAPTVNAEEATWKKVISPIPGTVYLKPNPDAANFVNLGSSINDGTLVCLIEAMKVFNEIKPDPGIGGSIKKILVNDGQAVEYGTVLFLVG